jgi:hypothetical protein
MTADCHGQPVWSATLPLRQQSALVRIAHLAPKVNGRATRVTSSPKGFSGSICYRERSPFPVTLRGPSPQSQPAIPFAFHLGHLDGVEEGRREPEHRPVFFAFGARPAGVLPDSQGPDFGSAVLPGPTKVENAIPLRAKTNVKVNSTRMGRQWAGKSGSSTTGNAETSGRGMNHSKKGPRGYLSNPSREAKESAPTGVLSIPRTHSRIPLGPSRCLDGGPRAPLLPFLSSSWWRRMQRKFWQLGWWHTQMPG